MQFDSVHNVPFQSGNIVVHPPRQGGNVLFLIVWETACAAKRYILLSTCSTSSHFLLHLLRRKTQTAELEALTAGGTEPAAVQQKEAELAALECEQVGDAASACV